MKNWLEKQFRLSEFNTDIKTELLAGLTTFVTMAYVLATIPNILAGAGYDKHTTLTVMILLIIVTSCAMALFTNRPFALAPGLGSVGIIHQRFNPDLQIEGILFTMDSSHYNNSKRNKQAVRDAYGAEIIIFDQTIPRTEALAETASEGVSIFSYDAKGKGAYSYQALVQEVLNHA